MKLRGLSKWDQTSLTQPIDQGFSPNDNSTGDTEEERLGRANSCSSQTLLVLGSSLTFAPCLVSKENQTAGTLFTSTVKKNPDHDI